jgi:hypothetical protein
VEIDEGGLSSISKFLILLFRSYASTFIPFLPCARLCLSMPHENVYHMIRARFLSIESLL